MWRAAPTIAWHWHYYTLMAELVGGGWTDWTDCGMLAPSGAAAAGMPRAG